MMGRRTRAAGDSSERSIGKIVTAPGVTMQKIREVLLQIRLFFKLLYQVPPPC
jgi:hypothetical protein